MCDKNFGSPDNSEPDDEASTSISRQQRVPIHMAGGRFDSIASELFPEFSRSKLQAWIKAGALCLDGRQAKSNSKLCGGELLALRAQAQPEGEWLAQDIDFPVVYEDQALVVVNKPAGLVVHPAPGHRQGTLLNALLYRYPRVRELPRAGIVHRLDKDTSGLMVVAKTLQAQTALVKQLQSRSVSRVYEALLQGVPQERRGSVADNIGRHPHNRLKMAVVAGGKEALTHYRVLRANQHFSHVSVRLATGRTHQIRVHMAHRGFPLVGDPSYGRPLNRQILRQFPAAAAAAAFSRQALHAVGLGFIHPITGEERSWSVPLAPDMAQLLREVFADE